MNDINQEMLFSKKDKTLETSIKRIETEKSIPIGYVPVNFISEDKLGPQVLHFRNYTMEELLELSMSTEENKFSVLVNKCLSKMNYEQFDCSLLHSEHIIQIVMTLYINFWNTKLVSMPYKIDESLPADEKNIGFIDIQLNKLKEIKLDPKFKEPFTLVDSVTNSKIKFTLPRVNSVFIAAEYVKEKYREQNDKFSFLESQLKFVDQLRNSKIPEDVLKADSIKIDYTAKKEYDLLQEEKMKDYLRVMQALLIHSINGKELTSVDEKIEAYKTKIDATAWKEYKDIVKKYGTFGIDPNYTFKVDGQTFTRRFSFRYLDFIPTMEQETDSRYSVQFDD